MNPVSIEHAHADEARTMELVRVERVDGLAVEHYACGCGHTIIVLSRVDGERQGASWPLNWLERTRPPS